MPRDLMRHNIVQLEELFSVSRHDESTLQRLEDELRYRNVPRAVALLSEVQSALKVAEHMANSSEVMPTRQELRGELNHAVSTKPTAPITPQVKLPIDHSPPVATPVSPREAPNPTLAQKAFATDAVSSPRMSIEDAYKVLRATPGSTWESIEQARRQLVQQSHPELVASMTVEKRTLTQEEANKANSAYAILWQTRACRGD